MKYDKAGNPLEYIKSDAKVLEGMIRQVNQHVQKKYTIIKPHILTVPKHQDFTKKRKYFMAKLDKLQKEFNLKDSDQFGMYHQKWWEKFVLDSSKKYKYELPYNVLRGLTARWAFFDKSYSIGQLKKDVKNQEFLDWAINFDKNDHKTYVQQNMFSFETLFFELGAEILYNMSGFLTANPEKSVQKLKKDIDSAIKTIRSGGDIKKMKILKQQLEKINSYGGMEKIVPTEGITFLYKGELFKITGNFGPVNRLLGLLTF
jgi:hypothetical protein